MKKFIGLGVLAVLLVFTASFSVWYFSLPDQSDVLNSDFDGPSFTYEQAEPYSSTGNQSNLYLTFLDVDEEYDFGYISNDGSFNTVKSFTGEQVTEEFAHYEFNYSINNYKDRSDYEITEEGYTHQLRKNGEIERQFGLPAGLMFETKRIGESTDFPSVYISEEFNRSEVILFDMDYSSLNDGDEGRREISFITDKETQTIDHYNFDTDTYDVEHMMTKVDRFENQLEVHIWNRETESYEINKTLDLQGVDNYEVEMGGMTGGSGSISSNLVILQRGQVKDPFIQTRDLSKLNFDEELVFYSGKTLPEDEDISDVQFRDSEELNFGSIDNINIGSEMVQINNFDDRKTVKMSIHPTDWETLDINDRDKIIDTEDGENGDSDADQSLTSSIISRVDENPVFVGIGIFALLSVAAVAVFQQMN